MGGLESHFIEIERIKGVVVGEASLALFSSDFGCSWLVESNNIKFQIQ